MVNFADTLALQGHPLAGLSRGPARPGTRPKKRRKKLRQDFPLLYDFTHDGNFDMSVQRVGAVHAAYQHPLAQQGVGLGGADLGEAPTETPTGTPTVQANFEAAAAAAAAGVEAAAETVEGAVDYTAAALDAGREAVAAVGAGVGKLTTLGRKALTATGKTLSGILSGQADRAAAPPMRTHGPPRPRRKIIGGNAGRAIRAQEKADRKRREEAEVAEAAKAKMVEAEKRAPPGVWAKMSAEARRAYAENIQEDDAAAGRDYISLEKGEKLARAAQHAAYIEKRRVQQDRKRSLIKQKLAGKGPDVDISAVVQNSTKDDPLSRVNSDALNISIAGSNSTAAPGPQLTDKSNKPEQEAVEDFWDIPVDDSEQQPGLEETAAVAYKKLEEAEARLKELQEDPVGATAEEMRQATQNYTDLVAVAMKAEDQVEAGGSPAGFNPDPESLPPFMRQDL